MSAPNLLPPPGFASLALLICYSEVDYCICEGEEETSATQRFTSKISQKGGSTFYHSPSCPLLLVAHILTSFDLFAAEIN